MFYRRRLHVVFHLPKSVESRFDRTQRPRPNRDAALYDVSRVRDCPARRRCPRGPRPCAQPFPRTRTATANFRSIFLGSNPLNLVRECKSLTTITFNGATHAGQCLRGGRGHALHPAHGARVRVETVRGALLRPQVARAGSSHPRRRHPEGLERARWSSCWRPSSRTGTTRSST